MNAYWQKTWKMWTVAILCAVVAISAVVGMSITLAGADTQPGDTTRTFLVSYAGKSSTVTINSDREIGGAVAQLVGVASSFQGTAEQPVLIRLLSDMDLALAVDYTSHVNFNFGDNTHVYFDLNGYEFAWDYKLLNGGYNDVYEVHLFEVGENSTLTIADSSAEQNGQFNLKNYGSNQNKHTDTFVIGANSTLNIDCNFGLKYFPGIILGENAILNINNHNGVFKEIPDKVTAYSTGWSHTDKYYFNGGSDGVRGLSVEGDNTNTINFRTTNTYIYVNGGNLNVYAAKEQADASAYINVYGNTVVNVHGGSFHSYIDNYKKDTSVIPENYEIDETYMGYKYYCYVTGTDAGTYNADDVKIPGVPSTQPDTGDTGDTGDNGDNNNNDNNNTGDNNQQPTKEDNNTQFNSTPVVATCSAVAGGGIVGAGCAVGILIMRRRRQ